MGNLGGLRWLQLNRNQQSGAIPASLGGLSRLTSLDLSSNGLSGSIPPELGNLSNLTFLHLGNNGLQGQIPSRLRALRALERAFLSPTSANFGWPGPVCAPNSTPAFRPGWPGWIRALDYRAQSTAWRTRTVRQTRIFDREICPLKHWSISEPGSRCRS